jgi:hypothetical protein
MPFKDPEKNREAKRRYKKTHPEKVNAHAKSGYWRNRDEIRRKARIVESSPEHRAAQHARRIKREFGITIEEYATKLADQNGVCAICRRPCATNRNLSVDHNHETKKVRGLLCVKCNTMIGLADDLVERLIIAAQYLEFWKDK